MPSALARVGDFLREVVKRDGPWVALVTWRSAALKLMTNKPFEVQGKI